MNLDDAIFHWIRCVRLGIIVHTAGSAEGRYRPSLGEVELTEEPPQQRVPLDYRLGWRVESAWRRIESVRRRKLLSFHYIKNRSLEEAARKAKIDYKRAEGELRIARHQLLILLNRAPHN